MPVASLSSAERAPAAAAERQRLPVLPSQGPSIRASDHVEPGTALAFTLAVLPGALVAVAICAATYGVALIAFLLSPLWLWYQHRKALAHIRGSCVRIGPSQLPELHDCIEAYAERLGMSTAPEAYVIEANVINAAAAKYGSRQVLLLTDDIIYACLRSRDARSLAFVIGHELAHMRLGHNAMVRRFLSSVFKKLSRLDEYSADRVALALVGDRTACAEGLVALIAGPHLLRYLDMDALRQQCEQVVQDRYATKAERMLTHPLLLRRLGRMLADRSER